MPTYRYPVLLWEDDGGNFTAALVEEGEAPAAHAPTAAEALSQIKEYLDWNLAKYPWQTGPDFNDAKLAQFRVDIRPEYKIAGRVYPSDETIALRLPCVHGRNADGVQICAMPTVNVQFYFNETQKLKDLAVHYAQERLRGLTPQQLSRFLPPRAVRLEEVVVQSARKQARPRREKKYGELESVAEPLGDKKLRRQFARAWEREYEVTEIMRRVSVEKANLLLVADSGAGKTTALVDAVRQIERAAQEEDEEEGGATFRFWMTSGARLIAGMQYLGQWEERCESVIAELSNFGGVLCLENLLDLMRTPTGGMEAGLAAFFSPYIQRGELRVIAEATPAELDACRRISPGFIDLFQILNLHEFTRPEAVNVLNRVAGNHARNLRLTIDEDLTGTIYRLFRRFLPYQAFPGQAVSFLNKLVERTEREKAPSVGGKEAIAQFTSQTGLPEIFLQDDRVMNYDEALAAFQKQVLGQDAACHAAASLVTTFKAGLNDPNRPLGVLLFCGPTGVGKTEMARALSRFFFGHGERAEQRLIRLDMSEYAGPGAAQKLLTSPEGDPSEFVKQIREQPFSVVLLDEIEKADPSVFDVFLSVFDEGRLTDRLGRVSTFRSAVIIMTSNLGAENLENVGFENRGAPSYPRAAMNFFRPEFFNRIDAVVQFNALSKEMMRAITAKELREIADREGLRKNNLSLTCADELVEHLIRAGFDQRYGARPLQRTIESLIVAPLAKYLLAHPGLKNRTLTLTLDPAGGLRITA
ncbi:MAG: AAA family ATPase [Blastocatellia bacterium]|nr:AAA family ATPase [Blastocatellia bacterium]